MSDCFCLIPASPPTGAGKHHTIINASTSVPPTHVSSASPLSEYHQQHYHHFSGPKNLSIAFARCLELDGTPAGTQCVSPPNILMFSIILTTATFSIALALSNLRHSRYFTFRVKFVKFLNKFALTNSKFRLET